MKRISASEPAAAPSVRETGKRVALSFCGTVAEGRMLLFLMISLSYDAVI